MRLFKVQAAAEQSTLQNRHLVQAKPLYDLLNAIGKAAAAPRAQPQSA